MINGFDQKNIRLKEEYHKLKDEMENKEKKIARLVEKLAKKQDEEKQARAGLGEAPEEGQREEKAKKKTTKNQSPSSLVKRIVDRRETISKKCSSQFL